MLETKKACELNDREEKMNGTLPGFVAGSLCASSWIPALDLDEGPVS